MTPLDQQQTLLAKTRELLEIDRDALLLPVAVARRVELLLLACRRRRRRVCCLGFRDGRGGGEIGRGLEVLGTFHTLKMSIPNDHAKH